MNPNPHFWQPRGFVLKPDVRSLEDNRFPQFGQMKIGIAWGLISASLPTTQSLGLKKASAL
jgi:hypothetical protein